MPKDRPRIDRVTTKHGDSGETSLADGKRYSKADPRIELVGSLDELSCALGIATLQLNELLVDQVTAIQSRVFDIGAAVATGEPQPFWAREAQRLQSWTEAINSDLEPLKEFVLPGGNESNARLHLARALTRRCERVFWQVRDDGLIASDIGVFLNRLSDYLFVAARSVSENEVQWQPLHT